MIGIHIFLTGATGYIGGSVLTRLLSHPLSATFQITVLVRNADKAKQFRTLGINAVVGSNEETELLKSLAADADVVVACADADDLGAAKAILEGLKERYEKTGQIPTLLHTSGTGVLVDNAQGMYQTDKVYSDLDITTIGALPIDQPHRIVDVSLVEADDQGYVETYIVLPSTIYGAASGPLVDLGLQHAYSSQIPTLVTLSLRRGQGGMIGQGKNIWPNVHIDDVADLYILIFENCLHANGDKIKRPPVLTHGRAGYYFGENGEHTLYSVGEAIARAMHDLGRTDRPKPSSFTQEELTAYFPNGTTLGSNSRCKAERSKKLGWNPRYTTKDMLASIKAEVMRLSGQ